MDFYEETDRAILKINEYTAKQFQAAQRKAALLKFDELTVWNTTKDLYKKLYRKFFSVMLGLVLQIQAGNDRKRAEEFLDWYLYEYSPIMKFRFASEVNRKRDRAAESIIASARKSDEYRKAMLYWSRQTTQGAIEITDEAKIREMKRAGVKRVIWHTERDERVCKECMEREGVVYDIDHIPPKPHWGCRCWYEPEVE